jgi:hypothetical protein
VNVGKVGEGEQGRPIRVSAKTKRV